MSPRGSSPRRHTAAWQGQQRRRQAADQRPELDLQRVDLAGELAAATDVCPGQRATMPWSSASCRARRRGRSSGAAPVGHVQRRVEFVQAPAQPAASGCARRPGRGGGRPAASPRGWVRRARRRAARHGAARPARRLRRRSGRTCPAAVRPGGRRPSAGSAPAPPADRRRAGPARVGERCRQSSSAKHTSGHRAAQRHQLDVTPAGGPHGLLGQRRPTASSATTVWVRLCESTPIMTTMTPPQAGETVGQRPCGHASSSREQAPIRPPPPEAPAGPHIAGQATGRSWGSEEKSEPRRPDHRGTDAKKADAPSRSCRPPRQEQRRACTLAPHPITPPRSRPGNVPAGRSQDRSARGPGHGGRAPRRVRWTALSTAVRRAARTRTHVGRHWRA